MSMSKHRLAQTNDSLSPCTLSLVTAQARTMGYCYRYRSNLNQPFLLLKVAVTGRTVVGKCSALFLVILPTLLSSNRMCNPHGCCPSVLRPCGQSKPAMVPMAPFTNPSSMHMFRRNMVLGPLATRSANTSVVSNPKSKVLKQRLAVCLRRIQKVDGKQCPAPEASILRPWLCGSPWHG